MKRIREDFSTILRSLAQAPTCVLYCNLQYILQVASLHKRSVRHQCSTTKTSKKLTKIVPRTIKIETKSANIVPSCRILRTSGQVGRRKRAESARDRPRAAQERPKSAPRAAQERPRVSRMVTRWYPMAARRNAQGLWRGGEVNLPGDRKGARRSSSGRRFGAADLIAPRIQGI